MTVEQYAELLQRAVGTQYVNEWSPAMLGARFPKPRVGFNVQVTRDSIRHLVDALGDLNPLYRDPDYARQTKYGGIVAPGTILYSVAYGHYADPLEFPTSPDFPQTYAGDEYEWFSPICAGDDIDWTATMPVSVQVRETRLYGPSAFITGKHEFRRRQGGLPLGTCTFLVVARHRLQASKVAEQWEAAEKPRYSAEDIKRIYATQDAEQVRGAEPRYWEDVAIGDEASQIARGPISVMDHVAWIAAAIGERFFVSDRINRYLVETCGWGTWDPDLNVYRNFHDDMFGEHYTGSFGSQRAAWVGMAVTNWIGDDGFLWKLKTQHRSGGGRGGVFWCTPNVVRKFVERGRCCVDLECHLLNNAGEISTTGSATVILPSRTRGPVVYPYPEPAEQSA
jgi:acyl dehydratase